MASLKLIVGSNEIDLLEGGDGYKLRLDGWLPQIAQRNGSGSYDNPIETIVLRVDAAAAPGIANQLNEDFEETIRQLYEWSDDPVAPDHIWLRWILPSEHASSERQALIRKLSYDIGSSPYFPPFSNQQTAPNVTLSIERLPFWETQNTLEIVHTNMDSGGENHTYGGAVVWRGNAPARISQTLLSGGSFTEIWMGFRTSRYGTTTTFQPVWSLNSATTNNGASEAGGIITWTPTDTDLLERMYVTMADEITLPIDRDAQRGTFAVLMRAKSTDATRTYNVRMSDGFSGGLTSSANWNTYSRVNVSGTSYIFYSMGTVTIPPMSVRNTSAARNMLGDYTLRFEAEEAVTSGSGSLKIERLVLIPISEGFVHINGLDSSAGGTYIYRNPDERLNAVIVNYDNTVKTPSSFDAINYSFPPDGANVVFAGTSTADASLDTPTDSMNASFTLYRRWYGMAGTS